MGETPGPGAKQPNMSKAKRGKTPFNIRTLNRDLLKAPAVLKSHHVQTGKFSRLTIGDDWVSTGQWTARKAAISLGPVLSLTWLRAADPGLDVMREREQLVKTLLGIRGDLTLSVTLKDDKLGADLKKVKDPVKFRRTKARYESSTGRALVLFRSDEGKLLAVDARWADLFALNYVWHGPGGPVTDAPEPEAVNAFFPVMAENLPDEASFATFQGGFQADPEGATEQ